MFRLFKKKEKKQVKEIKTITMNHPLLGELYKNEAWDDWQAKEVFNLSLWGRNYGLTFSVDCDVNNQQISERQELVIEYLLKNKAELQNIVENEMMEFFQCEDVDVLVANLEVDNIIITKSGGIYIGITSTFEDGFITQHVSDDVIFTDDFGIALYPEVKVLPNEEECYNYQMEV